MVIRILKRHILDVKTPGGGGGVLGIYIGGGCALSHQKGGGVLGAGTAQKRGVLGAGTTRKRGVLGTSTTRKRGI